MERGGGVTRLASRATHDTEPHAAGVPVGAIRHALTDWPLVWLALLLPASLFGQDVSRMGVRGGAGLDRAGQVTFGGQVDLTDMSASTSVELALVFLGSRSITEDYRRGTGSPPDAYHEDTEVWGIGVTSSYIFRGGWLADGPYFLVGLGLAPLHVAWRIESPTDNTVGAPLPSGGSFDEESSVTLGTILTLGIGRRIRQGFDVRAQVQTIVVPSTSRREDVKLVSALTLMTGVGL